MKRPLTSYLIIANVIVFLLVFSMPEELMDQVFGLFSFSGPVAWQAWRWVTNLFLHVSASHLFFNMLGLFFFGRALEEKVPRQWFLGVFFVAGFLGNLVFIFTSDLPVVGASGAMFGVMGAAMLLNPIKRVHLYVFPLPLAIIAITFTIFETFIVVFRPERLADIVQNVANISHVVGIATGALFAFFYSPKTSVKGIVVLIVALLLLIFLAPLFALIAGIGGILLQVLDFAIGTVLYSVAGLLSFLWV